MRVPRQTLRDLVTVEAFAGSGALGPVYAAGVAIRASVQSTSRLVTDATGIVLTIDTMAIVRPEAGPIRPESRVFARGVQFKVAECYAIPDERRPSHYELLLTRISQVV